MDPGPSLPLPSVRLAPVVAGMAEAMLSWVLDPYVAEGLGVHRDPSLERTLEWIAGCGSDRHAFAIIVDDPAGERHVGNVVLDQLDAATGEARLSVYIGDPEARGRGVASSAVHLALTRAFERLGLHRVWLKVHARNVPAIAVYARLGFAVEGVLRDAFLLRGERVPALLMAILRPDFKAGR